MRGPFERRCHITTLFHDQIDRLGRAHLLVEAGVTRQSRRRVPGHFQLPGGADCVPLVRRDDADEIVPAYNPGARDVLDGTFVDAHHLRSGSVGALAARAYDAAMQHARHAHVLHVDVLAADLVGDVVARNPRTDDFVLH